ncbi:cystathione beta-lyase (plasmid) [Spiroplasma ixodetis Y32]|nr:cystathione beta-lyase [Spiroplasma ixodetis Y32]
MKLKSNRKLKMKLHESRRYCECKHKDDLLLTIADSDFNIASGIKKDLIKRIKQGNIDYTFLNFKMIDAINFWYKYRYQSKINFNFTNEEIIFGSGVIHLMQNAIKTLSKVGDGIIIQSPVYDPFTEIIINKNRKVINNDLIYNENNGLWTINFLDLENKMRDSNNKILLLCSPHNPVGRVWTEEELLKILELSLKYNIFVISDEIWQDIVFNEYVHKPLFILNKKYNKNIFVVSSQSKTYNLGGTQIGYGICWNREIMNKMKKNLVADIHYASSNFLSACCLISGYKNPINFKWYKLYIKQITYNFWFLKNNLEKNTKIKVSFAQGLYLALLDVKLVVKNEQELKEILKKNHVNCTIGSIYGKKYWHFLRVDYSIGKNDLKELIKRFQKIFS